MKQFEEVEEGLNVPQTKFYVFPQILAEEKHAPLYHYISNVPHKHSSVKETSNVKR